jgi:hypothetical protein
MKTKKNKKTKHRQMYRNASAPARALPRAIVVRPRTRPATEDGEGEGAAPKHRAETSGWRAFKALGTALATTVAGSYLVRQDTVPPKIVTGVLSGLGALLAIEGPEKWQALGLGTMTAAGSLLGFLLIDDELVKLSDDKEKKEQDKKGQVASKPPTPAPAPGTRSNASDIPADALARAYERARLRMAIASDAPN